MFVISGITLFDKDDKIMFTSSYQCDKIKTIELADDEKISREVIFFFPEYLQDRIITGWHEDFIISKFK